MLISVGYGSLLVALLVLTTLVLRLAAQTRWWSRLRLEGYAREAITGLLFAGLALGVQGIAYRVDPNYPLVIGLIGGLSVLFTHRWIVALITPTLGFVFVLLLTPLNNVTYAAVAIYFAALLGGIVLYEQSSPRWRHIGLVVIIWGGGLIAYLILSATEKQWQEWTRLTNTVGLALSAMSSLTLFAWSERFIQSAAALNRLSVYAPSGYFRYAVAQNEFAARIKRRPFVTGLWIVFRISAPNGARAPIARSLEIAVSKAIQSGFPNTALFFNIAPQINGLFLPGWVSDAPINAASASLPTTVLRGLAAINELLAATGTRHQIDIYAGAVAYGWQSNSFVDMEAKALLAMRQGQPNTVAFFDPAKARTQAREKALVARMAATLTLDRFERTRYTIKGTHELTMLVIANDLAAFATHQELRNFLALTSWSVPFDRYMLNETLPRQTGATATTMNLIVFYAPLTNVANYDFVALAQKIQQRRYRPTQITLIGEINAASLSGAALKANLIAAQNVGFRVGLAHPRRPTELRVVPDQVTLITPRSWVRGLRYNFESTIVYDINNIETKTTMLTHGFYQWTGRGAELDAL